MKKLFIRKIREGKVEEMRQWGQVLSGERLEEVVASLRVENVSREFAYVALIGEEYYFIAFMESVGDLLPADMDMPINREHVAHLRACLEPPVMGEELYDVRV